MSGKAVFRKSGTLPVPRQVLKKPTTAQQYILDELRKPKPKGVNGVGYAAGVSHPKGSHRSPPRVEFVDVESLIENTVKKPSDATTQRAQLSAQMKDKLKRAELRREYLAGSFRKEEERLVQMHSLIEKREKLVAEQREREIKELSKPRSSDLTIPSLSGMVNGNMMRDRTPEEKQLLEMKRKYNRETQELRSKENKLRKLLDLYHASSDFIVTEEQLLATIENVFSTSAAASAFETIKSLPETVISRRNDSTSQDLFFGTSSQGDNFEVGLPMVQDFITGELNRLHSKAKENYSAQLEKEKDSSKIDL